MADASFFTTYAPYAVGAGSALEGFASLAQGLLSAQRARRLANYNAQVVEANSQAAAQAADLEALQQERAAAMALQDQQLVAQAGAYREARQREQYDATLAQTRAIVASSGLAMTGSPLRVYEETARQQQMDILMSQYQTKLQQRALREEAAQQRYGATLSRYGAAERLRIGSQQAALTRATADTSGVAAGTFGLLRGLTGGAAQYAYLREALKPPGATVKGGGGTPYFGYKYTKASGAEQPYILWNQ